MSNLYANNIYNLCKIIYLRARLDKFQKLFVLFCYTVKKSQNMIPSSLYYEVYNVFI